jgi:hypothetical protein
MVPLLQTAKSSREEQMENHKKLAELRAKAEENDANEQLSALEALKRKTEERQHALSEKRRRAELEKAAVDDNDEDSGPRVHYVITVTRHVPSWNALPYLRFLFCI